MSPARWRPGPRAGSGWPAGPTPGPVPAPRPAAVAPLGVGGDPEDPEAAVHVAGQDQVLPGVDAPDHGHVAAAALGGGGALAGRGGGRDEGGDLAGAAGVGQVDHPDPVGVPGGVLEVALDDGVVDRVDAVGGHPAVVAGHGRLGGEGRQQPSAGPASWCRTPAGRSSCPRPAADRLHGLVVLDEQGLVLVEPARVGAAVAVLGAVGGLADQPGRGRVADVEELHAGRPEGGEQLVPLVERPGAVGEDVAAGRELAPGLGRAVAADVPVGQLPGAARVGDLDDAQVALPAVAQVERVGHGGQGQHPAVGPLDDADLVDAGDGRRWRAGPAPSAWPGWSRR